MSSSPTEQVNPPSPTTNNNQQLCKLRDKHQLTIMQLTDLKEDYEKIKQLNTTLVQNFNKGPESTLKQLRLIIDGSYCNDRILQLEDQLHQYQLQEGVQKECKCEKIAKQCEQCEKNKKTIEELRRIISQKDQLIDNLRLQLEEKEQTFITLNSKNNNKYLIIIKEKDQCIYKLENQQKRIRDEYEDLCHKFEILMNEVEEYRRYYDEEPFETGYKNKSGRGFVKGATNAQTKYRDENVGGNENVILLNGSLMSIDADNTPLDLPFKKFAQQCGMNTNTKNTKNAYAFTSNPSKDREKQHKMKKQIQNILGELNNNNTNSRATNRRPIYGNSNNNNQSRMSNMFQSGMNSNNYHDFSIKDGVNRPNQLSFY